MSPKPGAALALTLLADELEPVHVAIEQARAVLDHDERDFTSSFTVEHDRWCPAHTIFGKHCACGLDSLIDTLKTQRETVDRVRAELARLAKEMEVV